MTITPLAATGPDDRGYTCEYLHERMSSQLIIFRKAGTVSGRHYHKGLSATKDPEIFILLQGQCTVNWRHIENTDTQTATITGPTRLDIPPFVWHEVVATTDCTFLELNSIAEHVADTFYLP